MNRTKSGKLVKSTCDGCGNKFKLDIFVPFEVWHKIKPKSEGKGGLLCPACIVSKVEKLGIIACGINALISQAEIEALDAMRKGKK